MQLFIFQFIPFNPTEMNLSPSMTPTNSLHGQTGKIHIVHRDKCVLIHGRSLLCSCLWDSEQNTVYLGKDSCQEL